MKESNQTKYIWMNGEFVAWDEALVHATTHSLHYAGAVYEGERSYNGKIFKLTEHINRLLHSSKIMHMNVPYSAEELIQAHELLLQKNNLKNAYIRPLIWRSSESIGLIHESILTNCLILAIHSEPKVVNNLRLCISKWEKPSAKAVPVDCKSSGHYNMMIVAKTEAVNLGYDDAILLDNNGCISECTTTNIFFVSNKTLITPIPDSCLNGITRQTVIDLAISLGLQVQESHIKLSDIQQYQECFITGTAAEIRGVDSIDALTTECLFQSNQITSILQTEYAKLVRNYQ